MKVLQINTVAQRGSIPRIMTQLYHALEEEGADCQIAYGRDTAPAGIDTYKFGNKTDFYCHVLRNFFYGEMGFGSTGATKKLISHIRDYQPDIIHLHNLHGFYLNIEVLFRFLKEYNRPVVWTLHDCWAFTGQCAHYTAAGCDKWKTGCSNCPIFRSNYPYSLFKDNSKNNYIRKKTAFNGLQRMHLVTPSKWLKEEVRQSFLQTYPVQVIPNGVDTHTFFYTPQEKATGSEKKIVLGVANVWTKNKGIDYFERLAEKLNDTYRIVLIGADKKMAGQLSKRFPAERIAALPHTSNTDELRTWYQRAAVFVNPTLEEVQGLVSIEAMFCGCPVVTFDTGGSAKCISKENGVAVSPGDVSGLLQAIYDTDSLDRKMIAENAAKIYSAQITAMKYLQLYREICP